ncbi:MAG: cytochrome c [candidate division KSB1 bacterium]
MTIVGDARNTPLAPLKGRIAVVLLLAFCFIAPLTHAQTLPPAEQLSNELGCPSCHLGLERKFDLREKAPDLSHAGLRFNPAYLFDFLQNPTKVRQHLGRSRMPSFHFDQRESLAVTLYLATLTRVEEQWSALFPATQALVDKATARASSQETKALLTQKLNCTQCHRLGTEGRDDSIDLATISYRLQPEWVQRYLVAPYIYDGVKTAMPSFFFSYEPAQKKFEPMLNQPAESIAEIAAFLFEMNKSKRDELHNNFAQARAAYPEITVSHGEKIFLSQNCAACHRNLNAQPWFEQNGPDLSAAGSRVQKEWLAAYLQKPSPLRPFGFYPGTGSRMPDFKLTTAESAQLTDYFFQQKEKRPSAAQTFQPQPLSAFSKNKTRALLADKLACLGCHQLGEHGGRIGPSFNQLRARLQSEFVYRMIAEPQHAAPQAIMPKIPMPEKTRELLANFLMQHESAPAAPAYLSLIDHAPASLHNDDPTRALYLKHCAACHGREGEGKGYNAGFLPKAPIAHNDSAYLSSRPDDTLYDGIHAGGYILNKSPMMPAWGETLSHEQIQSLVRHLRKLCRCEGPSWARDNR